MKDIEHPLQSLKNTLPFSSKDWGQEKRDAWIYGVICGWDDDCFDEFNQKFGWDDKTWQRLKRLNHKFKQLESLEEKLFEQKKDKTVEQIQNTIVEVLQEQLPEAMFCTRVWSAWGYGTMSANDFEEIDEDTMFDVANALIDKLNIRVVNEDKTAEQMFLEAGYEKVLEDKNQIMYKQRIPTGINKVIGINKKPRLVICQCNNIKKTSAHSFDELKAINKQIEELGW